MKKLIVFLLFIIPFTSVAQTQYTPNAKIILNDDGILSVLPEYSNDTIPLVPKRSTKLADGRTGYIYVAYTNSRYHGYKGSPSTFWCYIQLPNGVDLLLSCLNNKESTVQFTYPTGLKPGLYNFAKDKVKVLGMNDDGSPILELVHKAPSLASTLPQRAPEPEQTTVTSQTVSEPVQNTPKSDPCSFQTRDKTIPLYGRVQVVSSFADFKVQVVGSFSDLKVQKVTSFPNDCGEWQFVESFPDFTIQYVESFPDLKIQFVDAFPGTP